MKNTPLHDRHVDLGAKMVEYAGWHMPVQYVGIKEETLAVRKNVGVFDVSHMGELRVSGKGAGQFLDWALTRTISDRKQEMVSYGILCLEDGGVVDDLLAYSFGEDDFLLVVNAANKDKDFAYLQKILEEQKAAGKEAEWAEVKIEDLSDEYAQVAIQGRNSLEIIEKVMAELGLSEHFEAVKGLKKFRRIIIDQEGEKAKLIISRTGYTGEDGYEVYMPNSMATKWWDALMKLEVQACGLGARDALRLEAGMPLYGHEMHDGINPLDANMSFAVKGDRDFLGSAMFEKHERKLVPLVSCGKAIAREHYPVFVDGEEVGFITSGTFSPTLNKGIAYAIVPLSLSDDVEDFEVQVHRKKQAFKKTVVPFYKDLEY